jgi:hypothetical protein
MGTGHRARELSTVVALLGLEFTLVQPGSAHRPQDHEQDLPAR